MRFNVLTRPLFKTLGESKRDDFVGPGNQCSERAPLEGQAELHVPEIHRCSTLYLTSDSKRAMRRGTLTWRPTLRTHLSNHTPKSTLSLFFFWSGVVSVITLACTFSNQKTAVKKLASFNQWRKRPGLPEKENQRPFYCPTFIVIPSGRKKVWR